MTKKIIIYLVVIILLISCQQNNDNSSELLTFNKEAIDRQNEFDIRPLNLIDSKTKYLLNIEVVDSINSDSLKAVFTNIDDTYFNESIERLHKLKDNYNSSLKNNDTLISSNYLSLFKNELIHHTFSSMNYCAPNPTYNYNKTFSEVITLNPKKDKKVDVLISLGLFDTLFVNSIYIGGFDSLGLNADLIEDTIYTEKGFGKYSFVPKNSGVNKIKGVFEVKTKRGPKYIPFETDVLINE